MKSSLVAVLVLALHFSGVSHLARAEEPTKSSGVAASCYNANQRVDSVVGRIMVLIGSSSFQGDMTVAFISYDGRLTQWSTIEIKNGKNLIEVPSFAIAAKIIKTVQARDSGDGYFHYFTTGDAASVCLPSQASVEVILKNALEVPGSTENARHFGYRSFKIEFDTLE